MTKLKSFNFKVHYIQSGFYRYPIGTDSTDVLTYLQHQARDEYVPYSSSGVIQSVTTNMFSKAAL